MEIKINIKKNTIGFLGLFLLSMIFLSAPANAGICLSKPMSIERSFLDSDIVFKGTAVKRLNDNFYQFKVVDLYKTVASIEKGDLIAVAAQTKNPKYEDGTSASQSSIGDIEFADGKDYLVYGSIHKNMSNHFSDINFYIFSDYPCGLTKLILKEAKEILDDTDYALDRQQYAYIPHDDFVFSGTVTKIEHNMVSMNDRNFVESKVLFNAPELHRFHSAIDIEQPASSLILTVRGCGEFFQVGKEFLVFSYDFDGVTNTESGTEILNIGNVLCTGRHINKFDEIDILEELKKIKLKQ